MFQYANNQSDRLAASISSIATQILVETPIPRPFPTSLAPMLLTLIEDAKVEVVYAYAAETQPADRTRYTVIRGAEGTTPQAFSDLARIEIRFTAAGGRRSQSAFNADSILTQDGDVLTQDGNVLTFDDVSFASCNP